MNHVKKNKVLYILANYPQLSQTYIINEINVLVKNFEVEIIAMDYAATPTKNHHPFTVESNIEAILDKIKSFRPDIMHTHWLNMVPLLSFLAKKTGVPYTVRAHSFDTLGNSDSLNYIEYVKSWFQVIPRFHGFHTKHATRHINSPYCLGVIAFPFSRPLLEKGGVNPNKIVDCFPVVAYKNFINKGENGPGIMSLGVGLAKKHREDFVDLALLVPKLQFNLYSIGYRTPIVESYNQEKGNVVNILPCLEPEEMPPVYKKHQWMVYTADRATSIIGWPIVVAEAQASGVGVCFPNLRPDLKEYIGGAGYIYNSLEEAAKIIQTKVPDEMRELGFEVAKRSDIESHIKLLTDLWKM